MALKLRWYLRRLAMRRAMAGYVGGARLLPAQVLDLTNWSLTLPTEIPLGRSVVFQPWLSVLEVAPYFKVDREGAGVSFVAHAGGITTRNSQYPRSELREMAPGGAKIAWSTSTGKHTMIVTEAITHLPVVKADIVSAQIHSEHDDEVMIRLTRKRLYVEYKPSRTKMTHVLEPNYQLGTFFTVKLQAGDGEVRVFYEDMTTPALTFALDRDGCYFKAGAYTQSNVARGEKANAYGEVIIKALSVSHE